MVVEEGDTDERFGGCKVCGKELCRYDGAHPDFETFGELDEWDCDVCGKDFGSSVRPRPSSAQTRHGSCGRRAMAVKSIIILSKVLNTRVARARAQDVLFVCSTFGACDWGACKTCQILINPTDDGAAPALMADGKSGARRAEPSPPEIHRVDPESGSTPEGSCRDFQSNCWANLRILGQPCEFYLHCTAPSLRLPLRSVLYQPYMLTP